LVKNVEEWIHEGEELYSTAMHEYQSLESQLEELESRISAKQQEVNRIAQIIGKPAVEGARRLTAQLINEGSPNSVPNSPATIARALAGRGLGR